MSVLAKISRRFSKPPLAEQLDRVESLGLNCEVGFVLRQLGNERPSVFRWVFARPPVVLDLIENDFADYFDVANIVAHWSPEEIRDDRYKVVLHSNLEVEVDGDVRRFTMTDEKRRNRILKAEQSVARALAASFRRRYEMPDTLYVMVRRETMPEPLIETIAAAIRTRSGNTPFAVLEVMASDDPRLIGRAVAIGPDVYRGHIAHLCPPENDKVDLENWRRILRHVLAKSRRRRWRRMGR
jgi:Putative papain-like cysteine peptidase (DUF1796).